jgi:hypothetical protein
MTRSGSKALLADWVLALAMLCAPALAETRPALIVTNAKHPVEVDAPSSPHNDGVLSKGNSMSSDLTGQRDKLPAFTARLR